MFGALALGAYFHLAWNMCSAFFTKWNRNRQSQYKNLTIYHSFLRLISGFSVSTQCPLANCGACNGFLCACFAWRMRIQSSADATQFCAAVFFFLCVLFSIFDEIRKAGIPGRHCSFAEAGLNVVGCVLGCGAAYLIFYIYNHRGSHKNLKSK